MRIYPYPLQRYGCLLSGWDPEKSGARMKGSAYRHGSRLTCVAIRDGRDCFNCSVRRDVRLCQKNLQTLVLVQQHTLALLRVLRTVVQLVVLEEDLDERRPRGDGALDQRLRQRIFDVLLQSPPQRTRAVAAIAECLTEDPLLGRAGYGHGA